ncbi:MAG: hypothetical protein N4A49_01740 [Marinifilaceae bacterium]|jgi:hypothetical protein|nr:hypothetical protein [Marinifilaceae bacterium]
MSRWINFNIRNYILSLLGYIFRGHSLWINCLSYPLFQLWNGSIDFIGFNQYRKDKFYEANLTGQTLSLQGHLSKKFNAQFQIAHYKSGGLVIYSKEEGYPRTEINNTVIFGKGEIQNSLGVDFIVYAPKSIIAKKELVKSEIRKYKLAGKTFIVK